MRLTSLLFALLLLAPAALAQPFLNELHYDNVGGDTGEFAEIAVPDGVDIADVTLTLYNGNNGTTYGSFSGSDFAAGASTNGYTLYTVEPSSIQNGDPDGLAISVSGALVQFLSYDGTFVAVGGPADGVMSTDIGVTEPSSSAPIGESLQLVGSGTGYADFTWSGPSPESPGAVNAGQTFEGGSGAPQIRAPGAVLFELVQLGTSRDRTVTVDNLGDADLVVSDVSITANDEGAFSESTGGFTVAPGGSASFTVTFAPSDGARGYSGQLTITSNDPDQDELNVLLSGSANEAPQPEIDVSPASVDFGGVEVGTTAQRAVTVSNSGPGALTLDVDVFGTAFSLVGTAPTSVAPGGSETLTVEFAPGSTGAASGTIRILSDDADEGSITVTLSGNGTATPTPAPEIDVTPLAADFGSVEVGSSAQQMVTIANTGDAELALGYSISGTGFSIVGGPATVPAGGSAMATLAFAPAAAGAAAGTFTITSNDADEGSIEVSLSGTGFETTPTECAYAFGAIALNSTTIPSSGGQLRLKFQIDNSPNETPADVDVWAVATNAADFLFITRPPRTPSVSGGDVYRAGFYQNVPAFVEDGTYTYTLYAGDYNADAPLSSDVCDAVEFTVTKGTTSILGKASSPAADWPEAEFAPLSTEGSPTVIAAEGEEVRVGPNPMRTEAAFAFALEADAPVRLAVYDVRGREVAVVVDGALQAGPHTASLRDDLPAGVYVWRLTAGERVQTGRLTVVR